MTTQKPLATAFDARKSFFAHRASAIFPVRNRARSDLHIVFMNYWLLKNAIEHVGVNFRIYDTKGALRARQSMDTVELHNQVSVRDELLTRNAIEGDFDGMLEVEIVSTSNLAFPFPAIVGVYEGSGYYSCVHAAGRVKNSDEPKRRQASQETNWSCQFERDTAGFGVVPFFHYFVGAQPLAADETIEVTLRDRCGRAIATESISVAGMAPFSSRLYLADEMFDLTQLPLDGAFLSVRLDASDVFPRLVVGNFHKAIDFLEVTHSFPVTEFTDHCPPVDAAKSSGGYPSLLAAQTAPGLELEVRVFPTNCGGSAKATVRRKGFGDAGLRADGEPIEFESSPGSEGLAFTLAEDEEFRVMLLDGAQVPSRLNSSYRYRVRGVPRRFATDIATGAKSIVYPPKWRHWGQGFIGGGFDTFILFRNNTHTPTATRESAGEIRIVSKGFDVTVPVMVAAESCVALRLSELVDLDPATPTPMFVSWLLSMKEPVGETFWVAFRPDGAVFGEHGF